MSNTGFSIEAKAGCYHIRGIIDENADFSILIRATENPVIIDFEQAESLNSYGIRKWVEMLHNHIRKSIIYRNCPVFIIDQLNIVSSLLSTNVKVESMYLPYHCPNCDVEKEQDVKIDTDKINGKEFF